MKLTGKIKECLISALSKRTVITLELDNNNFSRDELDELINCDRLDIAIKKWHQKRSLNANAYMWVLCDKLAEKLNIGKEEVYRRHIREVGVSRVIELSEDISKTVFTAWQKLGVGWFVEESAERDGIITAFLYYGSSAYNTTQMSRLIDSVVGECEIQGIQTATPDELAKMKSLWRAEPIEEYTSNR